MKVTSQKKEFNPVILEITLESQGEVNAILGLFNFTPLCIELEKYGINTLLIRDELSIDGDEIWEFMRDNWK